PGYGVALVGPAADRYLERAGYVRQSGGVTVSREHLHARLGTVTFIADLLRATASRPARFNCFGMHEWAMVYRAPSVRHSRVPLRL
ncbi:3-methyladenine DNA glycosylase, partial [Mycobacterium sp. ITM-2017-0098]